MKHLGIIFLLLVPFLLVGQAWKAKPFSISVFNNATLLPPGSITATFNQPIHPGLMFGYEFGPLDPLDSTEGVNRLSFDTEVGNPRLNSLNCSN